MRGFVHPSVPWSIGPSFGLSVRLLVHNDQVEKVSKCAFRLLHVFECVDVRRGQGGYPPLHIRLQQYCNPVLLDHPLKSYCVYLFVYLFTMSRMWSKESVFTQSFLSSAPTKSFNLLQILVYLTFF